MRNLQISSLQSQLLDLGGAGDGERVVAFCLGGGDGRIYCATDAAAVACFEPRQDGRAQFAWRTPLLPDGDDSGATVVCLSYVIESDAVFAALSTGELLLIDVSHRAIEEVGAIEGGVAAAAWSPDGEAVAVAGAAGGRLLLLSKDWDVLGEVLIPQDSSSDTPLSVTIAWRGDGRYFATCSGGSSAAAGSSRRIHIWDREGCQLHATAEAPPGLSAPLSWQPNGRHLYAAAAVTSAEATTALEDIAGVFAAAAEARLRAAGSEAKQLLQQQQEEDEEGGRDQGADGGQMQQRVVLFERNGLQHGGFDLPPAAGLLGDKAAASSSVVIRDLIWSPDSELLAVVVGPPAAGDAASDATGDAVWEVQIWHRSNWHWYLKQTLPFPQVPRNGGSLMAAWDEEQSGRLVIVSCCGEAVAAELRWGACVSGRGTAAVIDGRDVLITPFSRSVAPPPSCAARARFSRPVNSIAFCDDDGTGCEALAAVLSDGSLEFVRTVEADGWEETLEEQQAWLAARLGATAGGAVPNGKGAVKAAAAPRPRQSQRQRVASAWDDVHVLLPLGALAPGAAAASHSGGGPLAEGRRIKTAAWLGPNRLLLVAAPHPEAALEDDSGDVLVTVTVDLPEPLLSEAEGEEVAEAEPVVITEEGAPEYAGAAVLSAAPAASGSGALLQLSSGALAAIGPTGGAPRTLGAAAAFPAPCVAFAPLTDGPATVAAGLTAGGVLYVGQRQVATGVTSFAVRHGGPGGGALLYTTRSSLLYSVVLSRLAGYVHREPDVSTLPARPINNDQLRSAMAAAMRPTDIAAAAKDVHVRAVEQGARLVAAPADGHSAVLQMPRGNLEVVHPRLLVLSAVLCALRARNYAAAWQLAVEQRVDLNLLTDDRWPAILEDAPAFVQAVSGPADMCDLLFALRPGSVLSPGGLYAGVEAATGMEAAAAASGPSPQDKVSAVCAAVRKAALAADPRAGVESSGGGGGGEGSSSGKGCGARLLKVVVTSYARSDPPDLEAALSVIQEAKEASIAAGEAPLQGLAGGGGGADGSDSDGEEFEVIETGAGGAVALGAAADAALRHLLLHVDADTLYRTALGMYDLGLAFMVVSHAQKDPGEYLDELSRFGAIQDCHLRQHQIDLHLRRWDRALVNIAAAGAAHFESALGLAKERGLLRQLIGILQEQQPAHAGAHAGDADAAAGAQQRLARALAAHAEALSAAQRYDDSAVTFMAAGAPERALSAYAEGGHWRMALALAGRLGWESDKVQALASDLAASLCASGQGSDAARVLREYLRDADGAVAALAAAREWREAFRVAYAEGRRDLVDTSVIPPAAEAAANLLTEAREAREKVARYLSRLREVRDRRLAMRAALDAADAEADGRLGPGDDDLASEAPSVISGFSIYTDATTPGGGGSVRSSAAGSSAAAPSMAPSTLGGRRAAKKQSKKRGTKKIKQGSPEEEAALREHLVGLGPPRHSLEEAGQLAELLVMLGHLGDAQKLQRAVAGWQSEHTAAMEEVAAMAAADEAAEGGAAGFAVATRQGQQQRQGQGQQQQQQQADGSVTWKWDCLRQN